MKTRKILFFSAIAVIILFAVVFALRYYQNTPGQTESGVQGQATGQYAYKLTDSEIGNSWQLVQEYKNLAEWPLEQQRAFATDGIIDAAGWRYVRGNETLHVWARGFEKTEDLIRAEEEKVGINPYKGSIYWRDMSELPQLGDMARIGVFSSPTDKATEVLFLYMAQDKTMVFIQYTNSIFNGRELYNKAKLFDDKRFLVGLGKIIFGKLA